LRLNLCKLSWYKIWSYWNMKNKIQIIDYTGDESSETQKDHEKFRDFKEKEWDDH